jgi:hypothetical protein
VVGVSVPDGSMLWEYPWKAMGGATTPVLFGETIIGSR